MDQELELKKNIVYDCRIHVYNVTKFQIDWTKY